MAGFDKNVCDILKEELPVYERKGPGGNYQYVKGEDVIKQLNKAFNHAWSSEVIKEDRVDDQILVLVALKVFIENRGDVVHHGFGSALVARNRDTKAVIDIGNSYKSAYTNALKKAAEQFGIGLGGDEPGDDGEKRPVPSTISQQKMRDTQQQANRNSSYNRPPMKQSPAGRQAFVPREAIPTPTLIVGNEVPTPAKAAPVPTMPAPTPGKCTSMQKQAITNMARQKGYDVQDLITKALDGEKSLDDLQNSEAVIVIRYANSVQHKGA